MAKAKQAKQKKAPTPKPKATPTPKPKSTPKPTAKAQPAQVVSAKPKPPTAAELRAALDVAIAAKDLAQAERLVGRATKHAKTQGDRDALQLHLQHLGNRALWSQDWAQAAAIYELGIGVARPADLASDSLRTAELLAEAGFARLQLHQLDEAEARIRRARALHDEAKRVSGAANAVYYLSSVIFERGQIDRAVELAREAVQRSTDAEDLRSATFHAYALARGLYEQGHSREAEEVSQRAIEHARTFGLVAVEGNFENMIANVALDDQRLAEGRAHYERALALFRQAGLQTHVAITTSNLGNLAWDEDRLDDALALYAQAIKLQRTSKDARAIAIALTARAGVLTELGRFREAQADLDTALATMLERGHERRVSFVRTALARLAEARGELEEARAHYAEAEMSLEAAGDTVEIGRMLYGAAGVEADLGAPETAEALLVRAAALDPASLSPDKTGVGEKRAGMRAVRALRELAQARIELARAQRLAGDDASALRRAATARLQAITGAARSLIVASSEVRRVAHRVATLLAEGAPVGAARAYRGTSAGTGWDTTLAGELLIGTAGPELAITGALTWDARTARLAARGLDVPGRKRLRGTLEAPDGSWRIRLELELSDTLARGRVFEVLEAGGEEEICGLAWPAAPAA